MKIMNRHIVDATILSIFSLALLGCGEEGSERDAGADGGLDDAGLTDTGLIDAGLTDAGDAADGATSDASGELPTSCEGACTPHALSVDFGGQSGTLERAFYGLTAPQASGSGQWEVYIEASQGGSSDCPQQDSPTPDWSLIVSGLATRLDATPRTRADDALAVTFFDFDGRFLGQDPFVSATEVSVTPTAANLDTELVADGGADEDGLVALELQASFERGEVSGHLVATHCPSLDAAGP